MKDVFLLNRPCCLKPFFNPVVIAPIKKNPIINHINLSKKIRSEEACPDLTISVRGSKGSNFYLIILINIVYRFKTTNLPKFNFNKKDLNN